MLPYLFVLLAIAVRFLPFAGPLNFLPHVWHFTPLAASLLFFGAKGSRKQMWIPLLMLAGTDVVLTKVMYAYPVTWDHLVTWAWYAAALGLGMLLRNTNSPLRIGATSLLSSLIFFAVSNFAVWASYRTLYAATLQGLINCYLAAVPFFRHTLAADMVFTAIFFGLPLLLAGTAGDVLAPAPEGARKRSTAR